MFGKRYKLFTLLGFDVHIDASWLILAVLIVWSLARGLFPLQDPGYPTAVYWWMAVAGAAGLFLSIVIHEFAHSVVARRYGIRMKGISLFIFGGVAEMEDEPRSAQAEFRMAIAGPITSLALALVFFAGYRLVLAVESGPAAAVLGYLALINVLLAGFNLIPAFPLDGGRVLRSYLWARRGDIQAATRTAAAIGSAFGVALIVFGVIQVLFGNFISGMWWFLIGMFLRGASQISYRQLQIRRTLAGESVARFMKRDPVTVEPAVTLSKLVDDYAYRYYHDAYPVVQGSRLIGCVAVKALRRVPRAEWPYRMVQELTEPCSESNTIPPDTDAIRALSVMSKTGNSRLMVADGNILLGVITLKDLLGFLSLKLDLEDSGVRGRELLEVARKSA